MCVCVQNFLNLYLIVRYVILRKEGTPTIWTVKIKRWIFTYLPSLISRALFIPLTPVVHLPDYIPLFGKGNIFLIFVLIILDSLVLFLNSVLFSCGCFELCVNGIMLYWFFLIHSILSRFICLMHVVIVDSFSLLYNISTCKVHHYPVCCWWTWRLLSVFCSYEQLLFWIFCTCPRISLAHYSSVAGCAPQRVIKSV